MKYMMKKITLLTSIILGVLLFCGCSSESNGSTTTTAVVPLPPLNLIGNTPVSSEVYLSWTDNSTNETGFKIERKTGTGTYSVVGSTNADITIWTDKEVVNGTSYTYRVYAYNSAGSSLSYTNEFKIIPFGAPTVTTFPISFVELYSASSGGAIQNNGGGVISSKGIVWSTSPNPTIALATKTNHGSGDVEFQSKLTLLSSSTKYYIRAYAQSNKGIGYGNEISFTTNSLFTNGSGVTDNCGNVYPTIIIGGKEWMQKNLDVCKYRNGDPIPQVTDPTQWKNLTTGAWCYYENSTANGTIYGKLYNWYAVNDSRGLAPQGWYIPSNTEWNALVNFLGGTSLAGAKMKETGTTHWSSPNAGATNQSGLTGIPAGILQSNNQLTKANFKDQGSRTVWWSSTENNNVLAYYLNLDNSSSDSYLTPSDENWKSSGFSVRCIKN
jgi:uncharacterized protein (TIGR02145 family)